MICKQKKKKERKKERKKFARLHLFKKSCGGQPSIYFFGGSYRILLEIYPFKTSYMYTNAIIYQLRILDLYYSLTITSKTFKFVLSFLVENKINNLNIHLNIGDYQ